MDRSWFFFDYLHVSVVAKTAVYELFPLFSFFLNTEPDYYLLAFLTISFDLVIGSLLKLCKWT